MSNAVKIDYLFVGHPRCGSAALAAGLRQSGLNINHERLGGDGMASWWHTGLHLPDEEERTFRAASKNMPAIRPKRVFHYLRRPLNAIPSIEIENEFNNRENNSFRFRTRAIKTEFGVDLSQLAPLPAAATSYVLWNKLAAQLSDIDTPILIEQPDFSIITSGMHLETLPVRNTTEQKFGVVKKQSNWDELLNGVPLEIAQELQSIDAMYRRVLK